MLRAGSLYFALFISFVVTLLLGSLMLYTYYSNSYTDIQALRTQIEYNAGSGITLALHDSGLLQTGIVSVVSLFDGEDSLDDVTISKKHWGVYHIIHSTAHCKNYEITKIALTGTDISTHEAIAMYVADKGRYISFSGKTSISGTCYFPKLGVRKAYIEGQRFTGDRLVDGETKTSKSELPALQKALVKSNLIYFNNNFPAEDSVMQIDELTEIDSLIRSFDKSTLVIYSYEPIILNDIVLKGNIRIISQKSIKISEKVTTENILLYAPSIYFDQGFRGNLQAFAQDSLVAAENCIFTYPSSLNLMNENINGIFLEIKENTILTGSIFLYQQNKASNPPYLKLNKQTTIHGQVYCAGNVELRGQIKGSLYCHGFTLKTGSSLYENHLLNATVNSSALSEFYSGSLLLPGYQYSKIIQWLN